MKKIIVSQPIEGKDIDEVAKTWQEAKKYLESQDCEAVHGFVAQSDSLLRQFGIKNKNLFNMSKFFENLSKCDGVYFTNGWTIDKNCRIARLASIIYNLEIMEEEYEETD